MNNLENYLYTLELSIDPTELNIAKEIYTLLDKQKYKQPIREINLTLKILKMTPRKLKNLKKVMKMIQDHTERHIKYFNKKNFDMAQAEADEVGKLYKKYNIPIMTPELAHYLDITIEASQINTTLSQSN